MNSFISSFSIRMQRFRLLLILNGIVVVFAGLELVTRFVLLPRSLDIARLEGYAGMATHLCNQPNLRIAFLGNSVSQFGIDTELASASLHETLNVPVSIGLFAADASTIDTWYYMTKHLFWSRKQQPDFVIINFFENNLQDGNDFDIGRVAQSFRTPGDWQELTKLELPNIQRRIEYLLSTHWATFAYRHRIKKRALHFVVHAYANFAAELNQAQFMDNAAKSRQKSVAVPQTALKRYLDSAVQNNTRVIFVAYPTRGSTSSEPYEILPDTRRMILEAGMTFIDLRAIPDLSNTDYDDDHHLNSAGMKIYTKHLIHSIAPFLSEREQSRHTRVSTMQLPTRPFWEATITLTAPSSPSTSP